MNTESEISNTASKLQEVFASDPEEYSAIVFSLSGNSTIESIDFDLADILVVLSLYKISVREGLIPDIRPSLSEKLNKM